MLGRGRVVVRRGSPKWNSTYPNASDFHRGDAGSMDQHDDIPLHGRLLKCARSCTHLAHLA
eukprot:7954197-Alexandrium_andersonii.AAC.1